MLVSDFGFDGPAVPVELPFGPDDVWYFEPSVGTSDVAVAAVTYLSGTTYVCPDSALLYEVSPDPSPIQLRTFDSCTDAQPCVWMRSDGHFCIVWADPEGEVGYNIVLQLYDPEGALIDVIAGPDEWVNDPDAERPDSTQRSPAVGFDDAGNIVVTWVGQDFPGCPLETVRVWARRFFWAGEPDDLIVPVSNQFVVDSQLDLGIHAQPIDLHDSNPTVALTLDDSNPGRFIIAWNVQLIDGTEEIHAQYFEDDGRPLGCEFRVNQDTSPTGSGGGATRLLADSAQHTVAYGPDDQVVATWTAIGDEADGAHFTLLPGGYADELDAAQSCLKGDTNRDGLINGLDIQPFVDLLLGSPGCFGIVTICPADIDEDGDVDLDDLPLFVALLVETP